MLFKTATTYLCQFPRPNLFRQLLSHVGIEPQKRWEVGEISRYEIFIYTENLWRAAPERPSRQECQRKEKEK